MLRAAMVGTLDPHVRKKRWCSRSKRWWNPELKDLWKALGKARCDHKKGFSKVQDARRVLRRAIRRAKRECWNRFLQEADGRNVWTAVGYSKPKIDIVGQALVREDGSVAEGHCDREQAILEAHLPQAPPENYSPAAGGLAFEWVDEHLLDHCWPRRPTPPHRGTTAYRRTSSRSSGNGMPPG